MASAQRVESFSILLWNVTLQFTQHRNGYEEALCNNPAVNKEVKIGGIVDVWIIGSFPR